MKSEVKIILLIILFVLYLSIKPYTGFRDCIFIDKLLLVFISIMGYYSGIHIYWIAGFFFLFMSILIWNDATHFLADKKGGTSIHLMHEYDNDPHKKSAKIEKAVIPLHIYQTWHTKQMPPKMKQCVESIKQQNPEFTHHLFDDEDCRNYIKQKFDADVLNAYDKLKPSAYKADLWRYCVLYKEGGIYMDIKFKCNPDFKLVELVDKEHFVFERPYIKSRKISLEDELKQLQSPDYALFAYNNVDRTLWKDGKIGIYNAFMVCKAGNPLLNECIDRIVKNVKSKNYGHNPLYPTGPGLMGEIYFKNNEIEKIREFDLFYSLNGDCIVSPTRKLLYHYPEYRDEQAKNGNPHYYKMWENKQVYKD